MHLHSCANASDQHSPGTSLTPQPDLQIQKFGDMAPMKRAGMPREYGKQVHISLAKLLLLFQLPISPSLCRSTGDFPSRQHAIKLHHGRSAGGDRRHAHVSCST